MIEKEKYYTINYILKNNIFPWFKAHISVQRFLTSDEGKNILKPLIKVENNRKSFLIKGENINNLLEIIKSGNFKFNWNKEINI